MQPPSFDLQALDAWLAEESGTLVNRVIEARSGHAAREIEAARQAFDAAVRSIEAALVARHDEEADARAFAAACATRVRTDWLHASSAEADAANERLNAAVATIQAELDAARADLQAERDRADAAEADGARLRAEFERALDELRYEHAVVIGQQALTYTSLPLDQLLTVFAALRSARTLAEMLSALVDGLAAEFSRVAYFEVRGDGLHGVHARGFDSDGDIARLAVPLSAGSLLTRAVGSGRLETLFVDAHSEPRPILPFGGSPGCVLAIPIVVRAATVALIYADDSDTPEFAVGAPTTRAKFAHILQQHAQLQALRIAVEEQALAELRDYAATLVNEVAYAHGADADTGRHPLARQQRLREDLERARRIFAQRTAAEGPSLSRILEERLAEVVDTQGGTTFGSDLAVVLGSTRHEARPTVVPIFR